MNIHLVGKVALITYDTPPVVTDEELDEMDCEPYVLIRKNKQITLKKFAIRNQSISHFPVCEPIFVCFGLSFPMKGPIIDFLSRYNVYFDVNPIRSRCAAPYPNFNFVGIRAHVYDSFWNFPEFDGLIHFIESDKGNRVPQCKDGILERLINKCHSLTLKRTVAQDWMNVESLKTLEIAYRFGQIPSVSLGVENFSFLGRFDLVCHLFEKPNSVKTLKVSTIRREDLDKLAHLEKIDVEMFRGKISKEVKNLWIKGKPVGEAKLQTTLNDLL